jgi:putative MATE family efflux protein
MLEVWRLAWPAITHMLLLTLVFLVDRLVLGNYATESLASLQISSVLVWTFYSIFTAFSAGTLAIAGRAVGAGDRHQAARAALVSIVGSGLIGVGVATVALLFLGPALPVVFPQAGERVIAEATAYLVIVLPTLPLSFSEATAAAALQASGDTRTPLVAAAVANVANLVLSVLLVFGLAGLPELGIRGAAIGAAAAAVLQSLILLAVLLSKRSPLPIRDEIAKGAMFDRETLRRLAAVSVPAFLDKLAYNGGYVVFVAIIGLLGSAAMAANQALMSVEAICFLSADGFGIAAGALVAQKLGAGSPDDARRAARIAARLSVMMLCTFGLVFVLAPRLLVSAFTDDPAIVEMGVVSLYVAAIAQPFMAYATVMRMALRGAGATRLVLAVTLLGTFLVRLPTAYFASVTLELGLAGIWIGSTLDWFFEAAVLAWVFRRGAWTEKAV